MKPITVALLTALAGFVATTARADRGRVNVDIGVTFGSKYSAPVYVAPAPVYVAPVTHYVSARGHWENVTTKTWMPGRWITSRDRWGRPVRFFENGYFAYRTERVWVDHHNHRAYNDRDGYRYNDDRRDDRRR